MSCPTSKAPSASPSRAVRPGAVAAWVPLLLFAGVVNGAWYDPSDSSTCWQDAAGTIPAGEGDPIGRIDDKSGNANHATQNTTSKKPTLRAGDGLWWLAFDGVDDLLEVPDCQFAPVITTAISLRNVVQNYTKKIIESAWTGTHGAANLEVGWWAAQSAFDWATGTNPVGDSGFAAEVGEKYGIIVTGDNRRSAVLQINGQSSDLLSSPAPSGSGAGFGFTNTGRIGGRTTDANHSQVDVFSVIAVDADRTAHFAAIQSYIDAKAGRA